MFLNIYYYTHITLDKYMLYLNFQSKYTSRYLQPKWSTWRYQRRRRHELFRSSWRSPVTPWAWGCRSREWMIWIVLPEGSSCWFVEHRRSHCPWFPNEIKLTTQEYYKAGIFREQDWIDCGGTNGPLYIVVQARLKLTYHSPLYNYIYYI